MFIGIELDEERIRRSLEDCLLTEEEFAGGPRAWMEFPDPCLLRNPENVDSLLMDVISFSNDQSPTA